MRVILFLVLTVCAGCPPTTSNDACNSDVDCGNGRQCRAGVCTLVVADTCTDGFGFVFVDKDGDGHGAGELGKVCVPLPPATGFSVDDSDCDDTNPHAFAVQDFPFDADNDGFSARVSVCGDGTPPVGAMLDDALAPVLATNPVGARSIPPTAGNSAWTDVDNVIFDDDGLVATGTLFGFDQSQASLGVGGFGCGVVPPKNQGIAIHVRMATTASPIVELPVTATLVVGGVGGGQAQQNVLFTGPGFIDVVLGGRGFGASIAPDVICSGALEVDLAITPPPNQFNTTVQVDGVTLAIFGADDCDDTDAAAFTPALLFTDGDGDGSGGGTGTAACLGIDGVPAGNDARAVDCDDGDASAHIGQTAFFPTASAGGTFDYNCDGVVEAQPLTSATACVDDGNGGCSATSAPVTGACGASVDVATCGGPPCALTTTSQPQLCR